MPGTYTLLRDGIGQACLSLVSISVRRPQHFWVASCCTRSQRHVSCIPIFVRLHAATRQLIETAPQIFEHPDVANAMQHELVHAIVRCLPDDAQAKASLGSRHHTAIMERFEDSVADCDRPLHLADICAAAGTSERMLRICCQEQLGMGPVRYLWLRRVHLVRRALIDANPARTSVTQVLTRYGFWQLGRFAVAYRGLFGESPSATLRGRSNPQRAFQKKFSSAPKRFRK